LDSGFRDWRGLLTLIQAAFAPMQGRIDPPSSANRLSPESVAAKAASETAFLAFSDANLVGCVFCAPRGDHLQISKLAVSPGLQQQGLGRALVAQAEAEARRLGLSALELQTRVELTENHATFARLGFRETQATAHPGYDRPTSLTLRRDLPEIGRFKNADPETQRAEAARILMADPLTKGALQDLKRLDLPQGRIVSGALYNTIWNTLLGRPSRHGVKDIDVFYWDPDTSWEAEDRVIQSARRLGPRTPPIEIRNQARVHLWFEDHFGAARDPLPSVEAAIDDFASITHCIGARLTPEGLDLYTPYGLDPVFGFRLVPNRRLDNRDTFERKATRALFYWPELTVEPWDPSEGDAL
jgi:GNAT superfamily N-acetyltransferase